MGLWESLSDPPGSSGDVWRCGLKVWYLVPIRWPFAVAAEIITCLYFVRSLVSIPGKIRPKSTALVIPKIVGEHMQA